MQGHDLKARIAKFIEVQVLKHDEVVQPGAVRVFRQKFGDDEVTLVVANRHDQFRVLVFYPDGAVTDIG